MTPFVDCVRPFGSDAAINKVKVNLLKQAKRDVIISPMPYYGEEMTVAELIDLVEFLHAQYTRLQPQYYRGYYLTK